MGHSSKLLILLLLVPFIATSQYTDVINSNRPGLSVSAYAVGKNVVQAEFGALYEQQDHGDLNTTSNILGADLSLRYGLLFEQLELNYEGSFISQNITFDNFGFDERRTDFSRNRLGLKYLVYDKYKNPENNKPNLYSWRADNVFQLKNLIPSAVSLYGGATFNLGDNPFYPEDPIISYRGMIATQSKLTPRFVMITNVAYDRISTDDPELSYLISLQHAFRNPKWSVFVEHQGIDSNRYSDLLLRTGVVHLLNENFQVDLNLGANFKSTPSRIFFSTGFSYRLDFHKDALVPIKDEKSQGKIGRKAMKPKKKDKKKRKKKNELDF